MSVTILVPGPLRRYCGNAAKLETKATTVREALEDLEQRLPTLHRGIRDETGTVRRHVNIFINASHMRDRDGLETRLAPGDELIIMPAVSGG